MTEKDCRVDRLNATEETYIETIDSLIRDLGYAVVTDIAQKLDVKSPSVTSMLKKLDSLGFVKHTPYRSIMLTQKGKDLAVFLKKREKSLKNFINMIGVAEEVAEKDSCVIEHIISSSTLQQLSKFVAFLQTPEGAALLEAFKSYEKNK